MKKSLGWTTVAVAAAGFALVSGNAFAEAKANISKARAEQIALEKAPGGKIRSAELEHEKGALVWSFDILRPGTRDITEVLVNTHTGAVLEVTTESPAREHAEARAEAHEAKSK